jgi:Zn-finger nucleic acid-binding protein
MVEMQPGGSIERGERVFARLIIQEDVVEGQQTQENAISLPEAIRRFYRGFKGVESVDAIKFEFFSYLFFLNTLSRGIAPVEGGTEERERGRIVRNWLRDKLSEALLANYDNIKNISKLKNAAGVIIGEGRKKIENFLSRRGEIKLKINWDEFKRLFTSRTGINLNNLQIEGIGIVTEDEIKRHLGIVTENGGSYLYVNPVTIDFGGVLAGETTGERLQQIRENLVNRLTDENLLTQLAIAAPTPPGAPQPPAPHQHQEHHNHHQEHHNHQHQEHQHQRLKLKFLKNTIEF